MNTIKYIYKNKQLTNILVHIERLDVFEGYLALLIVLDQFAIHSKGCTPGGQTQYEVAMINKDHMSILINIYLKDNKQLRLILPIWTWLKVIDALQHIFGRPFANLRCCIQNN